MRAFFIRSCLFLSGGAILFFNSCVKHRGELPVPPFNFHVTEGFEGSSALPAGWTLYNPDKDAAWQVLTTVAHTGTNCVGFNNCDGDGSTDMTGRKDRLISPAYDFTKATTVSLSFDVAYAVLNFKNQVFTDTLAVFSSTDGGSTWARVYLSGGNDLTNIPWITSSPPCWTPAASSDWRTDFISLKALAGKSNVKFAFENRSDWGQWIYLDNISITASSGAGSCGSISYAKDIQPVVQTQCAISGCHVPGGTGPTDFTTFSGVKTDADNGSLKKRMIDGNPSFMPATGKLPDSTLSKVQCWLNDGAKNN